MSLSRSTKAVIWGSGALSVLFVGTILIARKEIAEAKRDKYRSGAFINEHGEQVIQKPGAYEGGEVVERKSEFEGGGGSYASRKSGDRLGFGFWGRG